MEGGREGKREGGRDGGRERGRDGNTLIVEGQTETDRQISRNRDNKTDKRGTESSMCLHSVFSSSSAVSQSAPSTAHERQPHTALTTFL